VTDPQQTPPHLDAAQLAELREELLRAARRLERSERTSRQAAKPVALDQSSVGRLSRIDAIQNQKMTLGLQERDEARRAQIADALRRMEEGSYGACGACGAAIPYERLLVFPEAVTCAACGSRA
jgi:DnaK suppressor protein